MKAILLDLDGTLLWTDGAGRRAIHRALRAVLDIEHPAAGFRFDGRTDPEIVELLAALERRHDCVLGLLTGNVVEGARLKLRSAGIDAQRFRVGAFGSDHGERSALPAIAQRRVREQLGFEAAGHDVVIMGDTPADVTCGRGIGARAIAVATGSYSVPDLIAAGAFTAFTDFADTAAVVASIFTP